MDELTKLEQFLPKILEIGGSLIWALAVLFIGLKLLGLLRKILRRALDRSSVDTGAVQFLDALVKIVSYVVLALILMSHFGIQTASFITLLGTAGVAVGLSLKESLSNIAGGIVILLTKPFSVGNYIQTSGGNQPFCHDSSYGGQPECGSSQRSSCQQQYCEFFCQ